jgi:hypothetical protein
MLDNPITTDDTDKTTFFKRYYEANKERIKKMVSAKRRLLYNSEPYINQNRQKLVDSLNNGTKRWISEKVSIKYSILRDEKTLKYY